MCQNRLQFEGLGPVPGTRVTSRAVGGRRSDTVALDPRVVHGALYWVFKREDDLLLAFLSRNPEAPPDCSFISRSIRECTPSLLFKLDLSAAKLTCIFLSGCMKGAVSSLKHLFT